MFLCHLYEKTSKASAQPQAEHAYDREEVQSFSPATMHDSLTQVGFHAAGHALSTLMTWLPTQVGT